MTTPHQLLTDNILNVADWTKAHEIDIPSDLADNIEEIKTVAYYNRSLWRSTREFHAGDMEAGEFIDEMIRLIEGQMRRAWNEGMRNVGLDPKQDMTSEFETELQTIINSEFENVLSFAEAIESAAAEDKPVGPFRNRVDMWSNRYNDVVNRAQIATKPKERYRWVYGDTDHCSTCYSLNDVVATGDDWKLSGYQPQSPPNPLLECGGWNCRCRLVLTKEPLTSGGIPQL